MPVFPRDGIDFHYVTLGAGTPLVFQHGLGGDVNQPLGLLPPPPGFRLVSMDFRAHGETRPLGDPAKLGIASFADDLAALLDDLSLSQAVVGGISLGAAVAMAFAVRYPQRLLGLILSRPAWLDRPNEHNARIYAHIAGLIRSEGAVCGRLLFEQSDDYRQTLAESPDAAQSLLNQFAGPRAEETVEKLQRIPGDAPIDDLARLSAVRVPTLVLANRQDPIHPFEFGETLARAIPGAEFGELTPKSVSREAHAADVARLIGEFLARHNWGTKVH